MSRDPAWRRNFRAHPDRADALARYAALSQGYESSTSRIREVRQRTLALLDLQPGETVLDVACGSGAILPALSAAVGPGGRVIGIEQSPEMVVLAERSAGHLANVSLFQQPVESLALPIQADAALLSYTHDVLQSPQALAALLRHLRPGARIALAGLCMAPWWYGAVQNLWVLWGARHYLTTWQGLAAPWKQLEAAGVAVELLGRHHAGTGYLALARVPTPVVQPPSCVDPR